MKVYTFDNKVLTHDNKWLKEAAAPGPSFDEVTIGTQTWMAKDLEIDDGGEGIHAYTNLSNNGISFGNVVYYRWDALQRVMTNIVGWHIPTQAEWQTLFTYLGGGETAMTALGYAGAWSSITTNNSSGFNALPCNRTDSSGNVASYDFGYSCSWFSDTESTTVTFTPNRIVATIGWVTSSSVGVNIDSNNAVPVKPSTLESADFCYTVRLIKDS